MKPFLLNAFDVCVRLFLFAVILLVLIYIGAVAKFFAWALFGVVVHELWIGLFAGVLAMLVDDLYCLSQRGEL